MANTKSRIIGGEFAISHELMTVNSSELHDEDKYYYSSGRCALYAVLKDIEYLFGESGGGTAPRLFV